MAGKAGGQMNYVIQGYSPPFFTFPSLRAFSLSLLATGCIVAVYPHAATAADPVTLPAPPFELPFVPSLSNTWTMRVGADAVMQPSFFGSKSWLLSPAPILSIHRAGSPETFSTSYDSPSITLFDFGRFQAGPAIKYDAGRSSSSDSALNGLKDVGATVEVGAFAQFYPADWLRTRFEVRNGFGGHKGDVGEFSADAILPLTDRLTVSAGPRASIKDAKAVAPFFNIDAAQSLASGLPTYHGSGSTETAGIGAQVSYKLTPQWEIHSSVEYEHLFGNAAGSPLIKQRGSLDQVTFGIGISYSFDVNVR
jgi:outer membrane protein